uniref:KH domain-containing protein n=1 Tax=Panagrellus redivivus TaxID=6233 RepID=A0A7E4W4M4_PANRE
MASSSRSSSPDSAASINMLIRSESGTTVSSGGSDHVALGPLANVVLRNAESLPEAKPRGTRRQQRTVAGEKLAELMRLCSHEYAANESYYHAINALLREITNANISSPPPASVVTASLSNTSVDSGVSSLPALKIQPVLPAAPKCRDMPFSMSRQIPIPENPHFNLIGRIVGPRGLTIRELETKYQCRIYVRGQGSVRDPKKAEALMNKPGWEHLKEGLHVLVIAGGYSEAEVVCRLKAAAHFLNRLIHPQCFDAFKKRQLVSLALMNGTFRPPNNKSARSESSTTTKPTLPPPPQVVGAI